MATPTTPARPPYDPEPGAMLAASPLPGTIAPDMIETMRAVPFTAPIDEEVSITRAVDREERTSAGPGDEPACQGSRHALAGVLHDPALRELELQVERVEAGLLQNGDDLLGKVFLVELAREEIDGDPYGGARRPATLWRPSRLPA